MTCGGYPQRVVWVGDVSSPRDSSSNRARQSRVSNRPPNQRLSPQQQHHHYHDYHYHQHQQQPDLRLQSEHRRDSWEEHQYEKQQSHLQPQSRRVSNQAAAEVREIHPKDPRALKYLREADQNSFLKPLVTLCQKIITTDGDALRRNQYLSGEAISLISRLRDFVQARIDGHLTLTGGDVWESEDAARYRLDALLGLKDALAVANPFAFIGIAAFAFFEVCDSGFGEWQRHLYGAKSLLDYHCKNREAFDQLSQSVTDLNEMVARLVWFDTCGAIVRGTTDLIFEDWHRQILNDNFFGIVGCEPDTFDLLIRVTKGEAALDPFSSSLQAMDQLLRLSLGLSDWDRATNASRCAAVIAVLSAIKGRDSFSLSLSPSSSPGIGQATTPVAATMSLAVDRACQIIDSMSPCSQYYIHMAVPAYLAGMHASLPRQCDIIRGYWHNCNHAGVRRYPDALARCENRWKMQGIGMGIELES